MAKKAMAEIMTVAITCGNHFLYDFLKQSTIAIMKCNQKFPNEKKQNSITMFTHVDHTLKPSSDPATNCAVDAP